MQPRRLLLMGSALSLACAPAVREPSEGIFVGNPPGMVGVVGASDETGAAAVTAFSLARSVMYDCAGNVEELEVDGDDLLGLADIPEGEWCGLDMVPDGPITLEGEYYEVTFVLTIPVSVIAVEGLLSISERDEDRRFVLELGEGSAFAQRLQYTDPGTHIELDVSECLDAPLCEGIVEAVESGSALFEDVDKDGVISDRERQLHEQMRGEDRQG